MKRDDQIRYVGTQGLDRLSRWTARKPLIALMGEFSAGKSTLLNLLIGKPILPTKVTATQMPPVWLRFGTDAPFRLDSDGIRHPVDLDDLASVPLRDTRFVRIYSESGYLRECDLLDTPGISDPKIPMRSWVRTIGYANAVLWCTHAAQAWRESERSAWESLPERLRRHSLLVVTRADKLESDIDRGKVDRRLERETGNLFSGRQFISLTRALAARANGEDRQGWKDCGAQAFMDALTGIVESINLERGNLLWRYQLDDGAGTAPQPVEQFSPHTDMQPPAIAADPLIDAVPADEPAECADDAFPVRPARIGTAGETDRPRPGPGAVVTPRAGMPDGGGAPEPSGGHRAETPAGSEPRDFFDDLKAAFVSETDPDGSDGDGTDANLFGAHGDQADVSADLQGEGFEEFDPLDLFLLENPLEQSVRDPGPVAGEHADTDQLLSSITRLNPGHGHQFDDGYDEPGPTLADVEQFSAKIAAARARPDEVAVPDSQSASDFAAEALIVRSIWNDIQDNYNVKTLPHMHSAFQQLLAKLEGPVPVMFHANLDQPGLGGD